MSAPAAAPAPTASKKRDRGHLTTSEECPCTPPTKRVVPRTPHGSPSEAAGAGSDTELDTPSRRRIPIKRPEEAAPLLIITDYSSDNHKIIEALRRTRVADTVVKVESSRDITIALDTRPSAALVLLRHEGFEFTIVTEAGPQVKVSDHQMVTAIKQSKNSGISMDCVLFMGAATIDVAKRVVAVTSVPTALGFGTPVPDKEHPRCRIVRDTFLLVSYVFVKSLQKGANIFGAADNASCTLHYFDLTRAHLHLAGELYTTTMMKAGGFVRNYTKDPHTPEALQAWVREACDIRDGLLPEPELDADTFAGAGAGAGSGLYDSDSDDDNDD